jgi:hypothetical protein
MESKVCTKCYEEKSLEEYHNLKRGKFGKAAYCKECAYKAQKEWDSKNRKKNQKRGNKYWVKQRRNNSELYIKAVLRNQVRRYIVDKKGKRTEEILGETFDNVRLHIEKQFKGDMSWDNYGEWHIDHIIPLSSGKNRDEWIKLNHYTNLQPLWAEENMRKKDKAC